MGVIQELYPNDKHKDKERRMAVWDRFLTERDRAVYEKTGYGTNLGFGERPAVLVIDVNYNFVGHEPAPILESIEVWRNSCGEEGWRGVAAIRKLLEAARDRSLPIVYTTGIEPRPDGLGKGFLRNRRAGEHPSVAGLAGNDIVSEISPEPEDIFIPKAKPSAFFGTPLLSYLVELGVDSLLVCGTTTSGCVRASVIDAFSSGLRVSVVEECTFDRGEASHAINLFDMNSKYADVVTLEETVGYIKRLPEDLFRRSTRVSLAGRT
jgi:maleamate amidohydrolase